MQTPNISRAAKLAKIDDSSHYWWMKNDPEYPAVFEAAFQRGLDKLEAEVHRRAFDGVRKPVFHAGKRALDFEMDENGKPRLDDNGKPIAVPACIVEFSDTLAMFVLNGERPTKYRNRSTVESRFIDAKGNDRALTLDSLDAAIAEIEREQQELAKSPE